VISLLGNHRVIYSFFAPPTPEDGSERTRRNEKKQKCNGGMRDEGLKNVTFFLKGDNFSFFRDEMSYIFVEVVLINRCDILIFVLMVNSVSESGNMYVKKEKLGD